MRKQGGRVLLYRSKDLRDWEYLHPLATGKWTERENANPVDSGEMWECPDFFPVGDRHLLFVATKNTVIYWLGEWKNRKFTPHSEGVLLGGAHYAPKSFAAPGGHQLL